MLDGAGAGEPRVQRWVDEQKIASLTPAGGEGRHRRPAQRSRAQQARDPLWALLDPLPCPAHPGSVPSRVWLCGGAVPHHLCPHSSAGLQCSLIGQPRQRWRPPRAPAAASEGAPAPGAWLLRLDGTPGGREPYERGQGQRGAGLGERGLQRGQQRERGGRGGGGAAARPPARPRARLGGWATRAAHPSPAKPCTHSSPICPTDSRAAAATQLGPPGRWPSPPPPPPPSARAAPPAACRLAPGSPGSAASRATSSLRRWRRSMCRWVMRGGGTARRAGGGVEAEERWGCTTAGLASLPRSRGKGVQKAQHRQQWEGFHRGGKESFKVLHCSFWMLEAPRGCCPSRPLSRPLPSFVVG